MDKKSCSSSIANESTDCIESIACIGNRCIRMLPKEEQSEELTPEILKQISERHNIPIEQIYISKNGELGVQFELQKSQRRDKVDGVPIPIVLVDKNGKEIKFHF